MDPAVIYVGDCFAESISRSVLLTPCDPMVCSLSACNQAPLTMGFSRQEYWNGLPFPSAGDLPDPGIKPRSPTLQADSLQSEPSGKITEWYVKQSS